MYQIALIQNESEMMRYSWADIRPMVDRLSYQFDGYTAENIEDLFPRLEANKYDAIVIASNACNDNIVRQSLEAHESAIKSFLQRGKGLLVSFQMKMPEIPYYRFIPEEFRVSAKSRLTLGEHPKDGDIAIGLSLQGHTILRFPTQIDLEKVKRRALTNNLVEGIYWIYLEPHNPENYNVLLEDSIATPPRPLLITSRGDYPFRIVVSALAMDWQKMDDLWDNTLRYVVEGRPSIAVVSKAGRSVFDFRYLLSTLEINKLPYTQYVLSQMEEGTIPLDVHEMYLLDPSWSEDEIGSFVEAAYPLIKRGQAQVFYFNQNKKGNQTFQTVSNVREYQVIARNALTWLVSEFPEEQGKGYWAGSFWTTVDVLNTLKEFNIPVEQFRDRVLTTIAGHDSNGSYDQVLGASCAMLEMYALFLGREDPRTSRTLEWISERVHNKTLFERATAYDVFTRLNIEVPEVHLQAFKNEVTNELPFLQNEFMLYRYGRTLLTCGFTSEAEQVAFQLDRLQHKQTGRWVNIPNTAAIVDFLIDLQNAVRNPRSEIDDMVFRGIQYLRSSYTPERFSWGYDVSATAKSLKALRSFEQGITFPVDFAKTAIQVGETRTRNFTAIDVAAELNVKLQSRMNEQLKENQKLRDEIHKQVEHGNFSTKLASLLVVLVISLISFGLLFLQYLSQKNQLSIAWATLSSFVSHSLLIAAIPILIPVAFIALIIILQRLERLPGWVEEIVGAFFDLRRNRS